MGRLAGIINLRPEERQSFRYLFFLSLITGIGLSYYFVAVNTFLIQKTSVSNLPYAYIISGLGGVLLIKLYQERQQRSGVISSYRESILAFFIVALGVFFAFRSFGGNSGYAVYLAYLGFLFNMPFTIIFALSFSGICSRLYNMAQSKRLLALVGTGEIIASIIGYLTAPIISKLSGSPDYLLPIAAVCILPALLPISRLNSGNIDKLRHVQVAKTALKKLNISFFANERFYILIAAVSLFSVSAIYFVDYSYLVSVRFLSGYSGIEIATILGFFFSLVKVGELVFSFLSGHILSSKGVKFSILLLPLLLSGCFLFAVAGNLLFREEPVFILSFIFLAKFAERVIRKAISTPATRVLYQVTGAERLRIEATIEGVLNQVATVISGVLLLIFSGTFSNSEPLFFLGIFSVICFILFISWSWLSVRLYENYKKKIWAYLSDIRTAPETKDITAPASVSSPAAAQDSSLADVVKRAMEAITETRRLEDISPLLLYAPPALSHIDADDEALLERKVISSYYATDNFFYRLAVVNYFNNDRRGVSLKLLREFGEISDLQLRYELLKAYNRSGNKPDESEQFYFVNLCEYYSNELILAYAAQHDLKDLEDADLHSELKLYTEQLIRMLFELLKVIYERSAIQVIYEIITSEDHQDIESRLFALELLDNTLDDEMKKRLNPIFEPAPFDQKIAALQQFVPVSFQTKEQQLKELLMKDFSLVNAGLKEACLVAYYRLTGDKTVLNAFLASNIINLKVRASQLLHEDDISLMSRMVEELRHAYNLTRGQCAYVFNLAMQSPGKKERNIGAARPAGSNPYTVDMGVGNGGIVVDAFALALLIDSNQSGA